MKVEWTWIIITFSAALLLGFLGGHICSSEGWMLKDLGIMINSRPDRHETFKKHYPDGYRMDFVSLADVETHAGIQKAIELNQAQVEEPETDGDN
jgi:hypothetical protein